MKKEKSQVKSENFLCGIENKKNDYIGQSGLIIDCIESLESDDELISCEHGLNGIEKNRDQDVRVSVLEVCTTPDNQLIVKIPFECARAKTGTKDNPSDDQIEKQLKEIPTPDRKKSMKLMDRVGRDNGYGKLIMTEFPSTPFNKARNIRHRCAALDREYRQFESVIKNQYPVISSIEDYQWQNDQLLDIKYRSKRESDYVTQNIKYNNEMIRFITLTIPSNTHDGVVSGFAWSSYIDSRLNDILRNIANRSVDVVYNDGINQCKMSYKDYIKLQRKYRKCIKKNEPLPRFYNDKIEYNLHNSVFFVTGAQLLSIVKVKELQKRGMLHWHLVIGCENQEILKAIDNVIKQQWIMVLKSIKKYSKNNGLFDRKMENGETIKEYWLSPENIDKIRVKSEIPRHNCATYMAKYLSKEQDKKGFGCKGPFEIKKGCFVVPTRWTTNNRKVLKLLVKYSQKWLSQKRIPINEMKRIAVKCTKILQKEGIIKESPIRIVRAKKDDLDIKKGEQFIYCDKKNGENVTYLLSKSYNVNFNNYYQSSFLIDSNDSRYKDFLEKYQIRNIQDLYEYEFYKYCYGMSTRNVHIENRVKPWVEQLGYSDISQWLKTISENVDIANGYAHIKELIRNILDNSSGENFTPDDLVDYVNRCLKTVSVSLYQLAGYFKD